MGRQRRMGQKGSCDQQMGGSFAKEPLIKASPDTQQQTRFTCIWISLSEGLGAFV